MLYPKETSIIVSSEDPEQHDNGEISRYRTYRKDASTTSFTYRDGPGSVWIARNIRGDLMILCEGAQQGQPVLYKKKLSILFILGNVIYGPVGYLVDYKVGSAWRLELLRQSNFCELSKKIGKKGRKNKGKRKRFKREAGHKEIRQK